MVAILPESLSAEYRTMSNNFAVDLQCESTKHFATISVTDPEMHLPVEFEIRRCQTSRSHDRPGRRIVEAV